MMDSEIFFDDIGPARAVWCGAMGEASDLAGVADAAVQNSVQLMSTAPEDVGTLWAWLERMPIKIYGRFYVPARGGRDERFVSDLTTRINSCFKKGAAGAQIFLRAADLPAFADEIYAIRDDLFFNKDLVIGLDVSDIDAASWGVVRDALRRVRATALTVVMTRDSGVRSDFVGRMYAMLTAWDGLNCDLHFAVGNNTLRIEQGMRLAQKIRPELACGLRAFITVG